MIVSDMTLVVHSYTELNKIMMELEIRPKS